MIRRGFPRLDRAGRVCLSIHTYGLLLTPGLLHPGWLHVTANLRTRSIVNEDVGEPRRGRPGPRPSEASR